MIHLKFYLNFSSWTIWCLYISASQWINTKVLFLLYMFFFLQFLLSFICDISYLMWSTSCLLAVCPVFFFWEFFGTLFISFLIINLFFIGVQFTNIQNNTQCSSRQVPHSVPVTHSPPPYLNIFNGSFSEFPSQSNS